MKRPVEPPRHVRKVVRLRPGLDDSASPLPNSTGTKTKKEYEKRKGTERTFKDSTSGRQQLVTVITGGPV